METASMIAGLVDEVRARLGAGKSVRRNLPDGGRLHIDHPVPFLCVYRAPIAAWGIGARMNLYGLLILRLDWSFPLQRSPYYGNYVTLSLGPTF